MQCVHRAAASQADEARIVIIAGTRGTLPAAVHAFGFGIENVGNERDRDALFSGEIWHRARGLRTRGAIGLHPERVLVCARLGDA